MKPDKASRTSLDCDLAAAPCMQAIVDINNIFLKTENGLRDVNYQLTIAAQNMSTAAKYAFVFDWEIAIDLGYAPDEWSLMAYRFGEDGLEKHIVWSPGA